LSGQGMAIIWKRTVTR